MVLDPFAGSGNLVRSMVNQAHNLLDGLSEMELEIVLAIMGRFQEGFVGEPRTDLMDQSIHRYFGLRLATHHAYSTQPLKKENFEHALEKAFSHHKVPTQWPTNKTERTFDLIIDDQRLSLKTEGSGDLKPKFVRISKLMEAVWIKEYKDRNDICNYITQDTLPRLSKLNRMLILRAFPDTERRGNTRYDLIEVPKDLLAKIADLTGDDFKVPTKKRRTYAEVKISSIPIQSMLPGLGHNAPPVTAFKFLLDGSDDKLTIYDLDVDFCTLHAWWSLRAPG